MIVDGIRNCGLGVGGLQGSDGVVVNDPKEVEDAVLSMLQSLQIKGLPDVVIEVEVNNE